MRAIRLYAGFDDNETDKACLNSAAALIAGEKFSDRPSCVCPMIRRLAVEVNDGFVEDEDRSRYLGNLPWHMVGTNLGPALQWKRFLWIFHETVRTFIPFCILYGCTYDVLSTRVGLARDMAAMQEIIGERTYREACRLLERWHWIESDLVAQNILRRWTNLEDQIFGALHPNFSFTPMNLDAQYDFLGPLYPLTTTLSGVIGDAVAMFDPKDHEERPYDIHQKAADLILNLCQMGRHWDKQLLSFDSLAARVGELQVTESEPV